MGALTILATVSMRPSGVKALASFYEQNKSDHLLVDKWFALRRMAPFAEKMSEIRALTDHPAFSLKTPNKVRSLVGTFSMANPVCFNHEDGSGYRFLADVVSGTRPDQPTGRRKAVRRVQELARTRTRTPRPGADRNRTYQGAQRSLARYLRNCFKNTSVTNC